MRFLPETGFESYLQTVLEHVGLYVGLACYTALGAKVFQLLENPHEMEKSRHFKQVLNSSRNNFLEKVSLVSRNSADCNSSVEKLLGEYEVALSEVMTAGINIVTMNYTQNWDYLQSVFFSTTILTTIGINGYKTNHLNKANDLIITFKPCFRYTLSCLSISIISHKAGTFCPPSFSAVSELIN